VRYSTLRSDHSCSVLAALETHRDVVSQNLLLIVETLHSVRDRTGLLFPGRLDTRP
jgi:hypothetical protein